jgi:hypothetical protein
MRYGPHFFPRQSSAGAAEPPSPGCRQAHLPELDGERLVTGEDHLCDAFAVFDANHVCRGIAHDHHPFVRVVRIDRAWGIRDFQTFLERHPAPWANLRLDADWQSSFEAERNECRYSTINQKPGFAALRIRRGVPYSRAIRTPDDARLQVGAQIISRRPFGRSGRRVRVGIDQLD